MNIYFIVILAALIGSYAVNLAADLLNLRSLTPDIPGDFQGVYDPAKYARSQEYSRVRAKFGMTAAAFDLAKTLAFWFLGGFNALDQLVGGWGFSPIPTGLIYIGILLAANEIFSMPFDIHSTFVIEEKFGFNKTTPGTFIADKLKGYALSALIGGAALAGILAFFQWAGPRAWLYVWLAGSVFMLGLQLIAPTWIMPLFNKFTPLGDGDLKTAILNYAGSVDFPLKGIFVIDGSKRSAKTNAFFTGFGKNKRIALFDTLIEKHSAPEMVSILAHEIGHYKMKHVVKSMAISVVHLGILSRLLALFIGDPGLFAAFNMDRISPYAGLIFFGMLYTPVSFMLSIFLHAYSRRNEFEADRYSVETAKDPDSLAQALKVLSVANLSNLTPHPFYVFLKYTHPPVLQRIEAIRELGKIPAQAGGALQPLR